MKWDAMGVFAPALIIHDGARGLQNDVPGVRALFPVEDAQVFERLGVHTILAKVLIIYGEWNAARTTVVLVREPVGV